MKRLVAIASEVGSTKAGWTCLASAVLLFSMYALFSAPADPLIEWSGEATALMQAQSLQEDWDLAFERKDFDRYVLWKGSEPVDLELVSARQGREITFDRPFVWPAVMAPFLELWPKSGFIVVNLLMLTVVILSSGILLGRSLGSLAPWLLALFIFCSVAWCYVFVATADFFVFCCATLAPVSMAWGAERAVADRFPSALPWWFAGVLTAIVVTSQPTMLALAAGLYVLIDDPDKTRRRFAFLLGWIGLSVVVAIVGWWAGNSIGFSAEHFRFQPSTGFPLVDFERAEWQATVNRLQALEWQELERASWGRDLNLWLWNVAYFLIGRNLGVIPYFAPILVVVASMSRRSKVSRVIAGTSIVWLVATFSLRPFDFYGGPGAVGNRLFLPVFGMTLALALVFDHRTAGPKRRRLMIAMMASAVIGALSLSSLWQNPGLVRTSASSGYAYPGSLAARVLPYEASQRRIPSAGRVDHRGRIMVLLEDSVWHDQPTDSLWLQGDDPIGIVLTSSERLERLILEFGSDGPSEITVAGGEVVERMLRPDGGIAFSVEPSWPIRHHPLSWTPDRLFIYPMRFALPTSPTSVAGPLEFTLSGQRKNL